MFVRPMIGDSTGSLNTVGPSNAIYVDVAGDDATGLRGNAARPFLTVAAALAATISNSDEILIGPGAFAVPATLVPPVAVSQFTLHGSGRNLTFLVGGVGIDVLNPNNATGVAKGLVTDLAITTQTTGKCVVGTGAADAGAWLSLGLIFQNVEFTEAAAATLAFDLTYAGTVILIDCQITTGSVSFVVCSSVRFVTTRMVASASTFLTTWDEADPLRPSPGIYGNSTSILAGSRVEGTMSLTGQPTLEVDAASLVDTLTGLNLAVAGGIGPTIGFRGTWRVLDFQSVAAKQLPDTVTALLLVFAGSVAVGASVSALFKVAGAGANPQTINMTGVTARGALTLTADTNALVIARGASFNNPTYATPGVTGSIIPPILNGIVDIAAGGAVAKTWANLGFAALVRVGTATFNAQVQSNVAGADAVVPIAGKLATGLTITSVAQAGNTAAMVTVTF